MSTAQFPLWLLELSCEYLCLSDLAHLASTSRLVYHLITPYLYRTLHFHFPGRIESQDPVIKKLELFADPRFPWLFHTTQIFITGSWYNTYKEIESGLAPDQLLSPAVRMFNSIISSCIIRMPYLKTFVWDMEVSMTQVLVTSVMERPNLDNIQLRLGTDSTPKPFFHPTLEFHQPINVKIMRFFQINDPAVLRSIGLAISHAVKLQELHIQADPDSRLSLDSLLASCNGRCVFQLSSLGIQGIDAIDMTPRSFWDTLSPSGLHELTLHLGDKALAECSGFWEESMRVGLRPRRLSTNLVLPGLKQFLLSFTGLEVFNITPPSPSFSNEPLLLLLQALQEKHSTTMKVLAIMPGGRPTHYSIDHGIIAWLSEALPGIEELRFGLVQPDLQVVKAALCGFRLKILHILHTNGLVAETERIFERCILQYLDGNCASELEYIVFDDGPVKKIVKTSDHHRLQKDGLPVTVVPTTPSLYGINELGEKANKPKTPLFQAFALAR